MLQTYEAEIRNAQIHWIKEKPKNEINPQRVLITFFDAIDHYLAANEQAKQKINASRLDKVFAQARGCLGKSSSAEVMSILNQMRQDNDENKRFWSK